MLSRKQRPPYEKLWHKWNVIIPRRSISGRLVRGTVLRRRKHNQWIYKEFVVSAAPTEGADVLRNN
jgi:hypothetical protein